VSSDFLSDHLRELPIFHCFKIAVTPHNCVYVKHWEKYRSLSCTSSESTCELWEDDTCYSLLWIHMIGYGLGFVTKFLTHNMFWLFVTLIEWIYIGFEEPVATSPMESAHAHAARTRAPVQWLSMRLLVITTFNCAIHTRVFLRWNFAIMAKYFLKMETKKGFIVARVQFFLSNH
jgi:hypothetical protein